MDVFVKKYSDSQRFYPHHNIALGKFVHTKSEYLGEMKKKGLEPYDKSFVEPTPKSYTPSKKAHEIVSYIKRNTDKEGKVHLSTKIKEEIGAYLPKKGN